MTLAARVLDHLRAHPRASFADLMAATGATRIEVIDAMYALVGRRIVRRATPPPVFVRHDELVERMEARRDHR